MNRKKTQCYRKHRTTRPAPHIISRPSYGISRHKFFEFCHCRMHTERIEIFNSTFSYYIMIQCFSSFDDGSVLQANKEEVDALISNSFKAKTPRKKRSVLLLRYTIAYRFAEVIFSSGGKVKKDISVFADFKHILKSCIHNNVDNLC